MKNDIKHKILKLTPLAARALTLENLEEWKKGIKKGNAENVLIAPPRAIVVANQSKAFKNTLLKERGTLEEDIELYKEVSQELKELKDRGKHTVAMLMAEDLHKEIKNISKSLFERYDRGCGETRSRRFSDTLSIILMFNYQHARKKGLEKP